MDVNFHGCRYAVNYMLPILRKSTMAGIVNISSSDALAAIIGTGIYSASKAALKAYTEVLIAELGREMYISYVCPGFIRTEIFRNQYVISESRLIKMASTKVDKVARKIVKKIAKQKSQNYCRKRCKVYEFHIEIFPGVGIETL